MVQTKCGFDTGPSGAGQDLLVQLGPTLAVNIGFDPSYIPQLSQTPPVAGIAGVHALVDTGASESCIDNLVAAQLQLPVVDRREISGVSGKLEVNVYLAQIHVPALTFTIYGAFAGVDLMSGGQMHVALIGRTFLRNFTMIYEGRTGTVLISND